jgi:hypothetical protein
VRSEQRHINQILSAGYTSGQVSGSGPRFKRIGRITNRSDAPVPRQSGLDHERDILKIRIGIAFYFIIDRIAYIS